MIWRRVRVSGETTLADWLGDKLPRLRLFDGPGGAFDRDLVEVGGALLVVSQCTLSGDARKGRRPNFGAAAGAAEAEALYDRLVARLRAAGHAVETGVFGGRMALELVNDGPVTLVVDGEAGA